MFISLTRLNICSYLLRDTNFISEFFAGDQKRNRPHVVKEVITEYIKRGLFSPREIARLYLLTWGTEGYRQVVDYLKEDKQFLDFYFKYYDCVLRQLEMLRFRVGKKTNLLLR